MTLEVSLGHELLAALRIVTSERPFASLVEFILEGCTCVRMCVFKLPDSLKAFPHSGYGHL